MSVNDFDTDATYVQHDKMTSWWRHVTHDPILAYSGSQFQSLQIQGMRSKWTVERGPKGSKWLKLDGLKVKSSWLRKQGISIFMEQAVHFYEAEHPLWPKTLQLKSEAFTFGWAVHLGYEFKDRPLVFSMQPRLDLTSFQFEIFKCSDWLIETIRKIAVSLPDSILSWSLRQILMIHSSLITFPTWNKLSRFSGITMMTNKSSH